MIDKKETYADLVLEQGVALQEGQGLWIKADPSTYPFAEILAQRAYIHKAKYVHISLEDSAILSSRLQNQEESGYTTFPDWEKALDNQAIREGWAFISIEPIDDRLRDIRMDADKHQIFHKASRLFHARIQSLWMEDKLPWCVIAYPSDRWARQVLGKDGDKEKLWQTLIPILQLDAPSPSDAWREKCRLMEERAGKLNAMGITALHYRGPECDLIVGLCQSSLFVGAGAYLPDGRKFLPNIPTEEIFTVPSREKADGYITTTKPVSVLGEITKKATFRFEKGKVVSFDADQGKDTLRRYFDIDEGTRHLGECALVDEGNPIAKSGLLFASGLYDENASCHIALGAGYPNCLKDPTKAKEEGVNDSLMHIDFMVGSKAITIRACCKDGKERTIMEGGSFVL